MKRILSFGVIAFSIAACTSNGQKTEEVIVDEPVLGLSKDTGIVQEEKVVDENAPIITLDEAIYEFGEVQEGEKVQHVYTFTNAGKSPLIISNVSASCGCTTPEYSKHPINPGEKGEVTVVFDSHNQVGMQQKIITIMSNAAPGRTILQLKGEVKNKQ